MKRLLTLLLLLAPSVLAQNPVSGGPIPQSTYTTPSTIGGGGGGASYGFGSGTAQAQIIASPSPTIGVLTNGVQVCWLPVAANTGAAPTLQVGTLTAKPITKYGTVALLANDITTAGIACAIYDGTEFQLQVPLAGGVFSSSLSAGSGASAAGATATGGFAAVEAASTGWTPTVGQDYMRADSTSHAFLCSWNGAAEVLCGGAAFPLTVTGGVSGGIPYFSSTTVESASPILNANIVTKGGGAGNPPTNSSMTDNGTSVTSTDAGGFIAPVFTSNGTTAGFVDYPQGSTSAAVAPCNVATSICRQAPAAVTSYVLNLAAAAPVNNNSAEVFSNANPGVGTFAKMPQTAITSGTAYTNATTTFSNVVGGSGQTLQLTVEANTNYILTCQILWSASGATSGPKFQFTGPASPTAVQYSVVQAVTATTDGTAGATAFSTSLNASGATVVTGTNEPAELSLGLVNGANAGTVVLQAAAQGAGTLTIQPGSFCQGQ